MLLSRTVSAGSDARAGRITESSGPVMSVVNNAISTSTVNSRWLMRPASSPTLSAISSVSPRVFTSAAIVADGRG